MRINENLFVNPLNISAIKTDGESIKILFNNGQWINTSDFYMEDIEDWSYETDNQNSLIRIGLSKNK